MLAVRSFWFLFRGPQREKERMDKCINSQHWKKKERLLTIKELLHFVRSGALY
jgi:hypothetical protein